VLGVLVMASLLGKQLQAKEADDKLREKLEQAIQTLDKDGSGTLTMAELAEHFGMGHLIKKSDEPLEVAEDTFMSAEERLSQLVASSKLSKRAGGLIVYFLLWDVFVTTLAYGGIALQFKYDPTSTEVVWKAHFALFAGKILIALLSFPFLIFFVPVLSSALTHTKPTGYDRHGNLLFKLSGAEVKQRYIIEQQRRYNAYHKMKEGAPTSCPDHLELRWNAYLGFREVDKKASKAAKKYASQLGSDFDDSSPAKPVYAPAPTNGAADSSIKYPELKTLPADAPQTDGGAPPKKGLGVPGWPEFVVDKDGKVRGCDNRLCEDPGDFLKTAFVQPQHNLSIDKKPPPKSSATDMV